MVEVVEIVEVVVRLLVIIKIIEKRGDKKKDINRILINNRIINIVIIRVNSRIIIDSRVMIDTRIVVDSRNGSRMGTEVIRKRSGLIAVVRRNRRYRILRNCILQCRLRL